MQVDCQMAGGCRKGTQLDFQMVEIVKWAPVGF